MKRIKHQLSSSISSSTNSAGVKLLLEYEPYERYGGSTGLKRVTIRGNDLLDALTKMVDHLLLYVDREIIEEEDYTAEDIIQSIQASNGDGCDYIVLLQNQTTGEVYIESEYYEDEEEEW